MALQDLADWWEEKKTHINKSSGSLKGQMSDTGQWGEGSAWAGMVCSREAGSWKIS